MNENKIVVWCHACIHLSVVRSRSTEITVQLCDVYVWIHMYFGNTWRDKTFKNLGIITCIVHKHNTAYTYSKCEPRYENQPQGNYLVLGVSHWWKWQNHRSARYIVQFYRYPEWWNLTSSLIILQVASPAVLLNVVSGFLFAVRTTTDSISFPSVLCIDGWRYVILSVVWTLSSGELDGQ